MAMATADVVLRLGTERLQARFSVSEEPISARDLLPIARAIVGRIMQQAIDDVNASGKEISCKAGCGACCRQLVPLSTAEARMVADLVEAMPEPRRTEIKQRFARALESLEASGLLAKLRNRKDWVPEDVERVGMEYFHLGIACPFLEEESCSIHPDRPLTCREYLVTSPAENCAQPRRDNIDQVEMMTVWPALAKLDRLPPGARFLTWVPLTLALEPFDRPEATEPGPRMLEEFLRQLTGKPLPGAPLNPFGKVNDAAAS